MGLVIGIVVIVDRRGRIVRIIISRVPKRIPIIMMVLVFMFGGG